MRVIAREYLDFQPCEIDTLGYSWGHDIKEFKFQILHTWKTKHEDNNREVSSYSLVTFKAILSVLCLQAELIQP